MGFFECCHHCTKRYLGCHSSCPEYIEQKRLWEERKEVERQAKLTEPVLPSARMRAIYKNSKSNSK